MEKLLRPLVFLTYLTLTILNQCDGQSDKISVEAGYFNFNPKMEKLQSFLDSKSIPKLKSNHHLYFLNIPVYLFDDNGGKLEKFTVSIFESWDAENGDNVYPVKIQWIKLLLGVSYTRYFLPESRVNPFLGGGLGIHFSKLDFKNQLWSRGFDFNVFTGIELDIIRHRFFTLYFSTQAGYKLTISAQDFESTKVINQFGNVIYYEVIDQLNFGEEFSGPFYGLYIGLILPF